MQCTVLTKPQNVFSGIGSTTKEDAVVEHHNNPRMVMDKVVGEGLLNQNLGRLERIPFHSV